MGAVINPKIQSEIQVTLIATGFGGAETRKAPVKVSDVFARLDTPAAPPPPSPEPPRPAPRSYEPRSTEPKPLDDPDMPSFLRRKRVE